MLTILIFLLSLLSLHGKFRISIWLIPIITCYSKVQVRKYGGFYADC